MLRRQAGLLASAGLLAHAGLKTRTGLKVTPDTPPPSQNRIVFEGQPVTFNGDPVVQEA